MKARIVAWHWDEDFAAKFGPEFSVHDLPDDTSEAFRLLQSFGRFQVCQPGVKYSDSWTGEIPAAADSWLIVFQNDYD